MAATSTERAEQTIGLLWRHRDEPKVRRGPKPRHDLDEVVATAIELADARGLAGLTVRALADRLNIARMAVYTYVADLDQLLELMTDTAAGELFDGRIRAFPYGPRGRRPQDPVRGWQRSATTVANANLELLRRHPWLIERPNDRPVLGPWTTAKYDRELACFEGIGLTDLETDLALWQLLNHVRGAAADLVATDRHRESTADWWAGAGAAVAARIGAEEFPHAVRVGQAAGEAQGTAYDASSSYRFGLELLLGGLQAMVDRRAAAEIGRIDPPTIGLRQESTQR